MSAFPGQTSRADARECAGGVCRAVRVFPGSKSRGMGGGREADGWSGVSTADHVGGSGGAAPHVFVTLARLINATSRVTVYPAFANNLARSPVEFAHASPARRS